jgi:Tol biopolymer transport system component
VRNGGEDGVDCGGSRCAPCLCTFEAPERLADPNFAGNDLWSPTLSSDGLSLYFGLTVPGLAEQVAAATRADRASAFGLGQPLAAPVNLGKEGTPYLSRDGLSLYFYSQRTGGAGNRDLYVATRQTSADAFDDVTPLSSLNTSGLDYQPWLTPDELTIYFASGSAGSCDIFRATRPSVSATFDPPEAVTELNTSSDEGGITLSANGREAILASNRPGGSGARDLFRFTRARTDVPFSDPEPIGELNTADNELDPAFSPDDNELYFASNRGGSDSALYRAVRRCTR